jgi:hypothetical protein
MRVNVYGEELTDRVEIVRKSVNQETFVAIRFYLKSHPDLHHSFDDNDESAVTIWAPWTKKTGNQLDVLYTMFYEAIQRISQLRNEQSKGI